MSRYIDYSEELGSVYGTRTIVELLGSAGHGCMYKVKVECKCGKVDEVSLSVIKRGLSTTCRKCSYRSLEEKRDTKFVNMAKACIWRCSEYHPSCASYYDRGITVYSAWTSSPKLFGIYLKNKWFKQTGTNSLATYGKGKSKLSIDRVDNSKGYCPGNIRFATALEQTNNRRPSNEWCDNYWDTRKPIGGY